MKKEVVDGATTYSDIFTDEYGYAWNILVRSNSVCLYATHTGISGHSVYYDTLDNEPPNGTARAVMGRLAEMVEGINALLSVVPRGLQSEIQDQQFGDTDTPAGWIGA
jgi:hypothetical protein